MIVIVPDGKSVDLGSIDKNNSHVYLLVPSLIEVMFSGGCDSDSDIWWWL